MEESVECDLIVELGIVVLLDLVKCSLYFLVVGEVIVRGGLEIADVFLFLLFELFDPVCCGVLFWFQGSNVVKRNNN